MNLLRWITTGIPWPDKREPEMAANDKLREIYERHRNERPRPTTSGPTSARTPMGP